MGISNKYKDTLDDFIDTSDPETFDWVGQIDVRSYNTPMFENNLADLSEENSLNENLSDRLSRMAPKNQDSQVHQRCVIAS